jgi:hypothetical protein
VSQGRVPLSQTESAKDSGHYPGLYGAEILLQLAELAHSYLAGDPGRTKKAGGTMAWVPSRESHPFRH